MAERILIIRTSSLGDVVLASSILGTLKAQRPYSEIHLLVKSDYAELYEDDPRLTGLIRLEPSIHSGIRGLCRLLRCVRRMDFDLLIDLQGNFRSFTMRAFGGAAKKLRAPKRRWLRSAMVHLRRRPTNPERALDLYFKPLRQIGVSWVSNHPSLFLDPRLHEQMARLLAQGGISPNDLVVGINPGARWETKRWTTEGFAEVVDRLSKTFHAKILMLGNREDLGFVTHILRVMKARPVVMTGELSLRELVAAIDRCDLLLTNDSGPMHIAAARDVPVVAIFGPTHPDLGFAPSGEHDIVLTADLPCSPCSLHGEKLCRRDRRYCMEEITADQVFDQIQGLLREPRVRGRGL